EGRALVVRGEPGVGKTVLLDYLAGRASGRRGPRPRTPVLSVYTLHKAHRAQGLCQRTGSRQIRLVRVRFPPGRLPRRRGEGLGSSAAWRAVAATISS